MIYLYIYLLLNLFAAIQISYWVKSNIGDFHDLVDLLRVMDGDTLEDLSNKEIIGCIFAMLFVAGFIVWVIAFMGEK